MRAVKKGQAALSVLWLLLRLVFLPKLLESVDLSPEDIHAALPKGRVAEVDADFVHKLLRGEATAGSEDVEVLFGEGLAFLLVLLVQGQDEKLAEGIGVDVERGCR